MDMKSLQEKQAEIEQRFNAQKEKVSQIESQLVLEREELVLLRGEYRVISDLITAMPKKDKK